MCRAGEDRHYDFRAGEGAAGDVAGEGFDVGDYHGAGFFPGGAADSAAVGDAEAGGWALERPQYQLLPKTRALTVAPSGSITHNGIPHNIESHPEEFHPFVNEGGDFGHAGDGIRLIPQKSGDILIEAEIPEGLTGERADALKEILALDPRPGYQDDPERIYAFSYGSYTVRFRVCEDKLYVTDFEER